LGCAVVIKAYHFCEMARGVREDSATTVTTSLRGCFKSNREARAEFYNSIDYTGSVF
jgi:GTP cyclohydrolase I